MKNDAKSLDVALSGNTGPEVMPCKNSYWTSPPKQEEYGVEISTSNNNKRRAPITETGEFEARNDIGLMEEHVYPPLPSKRLKFRLSFHDNFLRSNHHTSARTPKKGASRMRMRSGWDNIAYLLY